MPYLLSFTFVFLCYFPEVSSAESGFLSLFSKPKPMIAALMIEKDLSTPEKINKAISWGKEQIKTAEKYQMDGILFEFRGGKILQPKIQAPQYQAMLQVSRALVRSARSVVVGVEILWHYPEETLKLAHESGAKFVRIDFFSDQVIADKKKVPINPQKIVDYKNKIGAQAVFMLTDIQVKYSQMINKKISLKTSAEKARISGSDGVIVTSTRSGKAPDPQRPRLAQQGAGSLPVVIGSGFSYKNVKSLLPHADAVVVGTSISVKTGGPLVAKKVARLMNEVSQFRRQKK